MEQVDQPRILAEDILKMWRRLQAIDPSTVNVESLSTDGPLSNYTVEPSALLGGMVDITALDGSGGYIVHEEMVPVVLKMLREKAADTPHLAGES